MNAGDSYGVRVALSGDTAMVAAAFGNGGNQGRPAWGAAYLFDVTTGEQLRKLISSESVGSRFGVSVGISGNTAIVGQDNTFTSIGLSFVYDVSRNQTTPGDFNNDGTVDAADYIVWRNGLGTTYTQTDYNAWRANFGRSAASAASAASSSTNPAVPEPPAGWLMSCALAATLHMHRSHRRIPRDPRSILRVSALQ